MEQSHNLKLPGSEEGYSSLLGSWSAYSKKNDEYLHAKMKLLQEQRPANQALTIDHIWDGDEHNKNAALTIFRHFDSATVVSGLIGATTKNILVNRLSIIRAHTLSTSR